jgi:hypothetical protein
MCARPDRGAAAGEPRAPEGARSDGAAPGQSGPPARDRGGILAAAREGDFAGLLAVLDPDVELRTDAAAVLGSTAREAAGAPKLAPEVYGAAAVAEAFAGRARGAQLALVDGAVGGGVGAGRAATRRLQVHRLGWEDCRDRCGRRSGTVLGLEVVVLAE